MIAPRPARRNLFRAAILSACFAACLSLLPSQETQVPSQREERFRHNNLGVALMFQSKFAEAREEFAKAVALDRTFLQARVNEGIALLALSRFDEAQKVFQEVLTRDPNQIRAHYNLGLIDRIQGKFELAIEEFSRVLALDSDDKDAHYYLGASYFQTRDFRKAIEQYEQTLERDPNYVSAIYGIGQAYSALGDRAKARAYFLRYQQLRESSPLNRPASLVYGEQGRYSLADDSLPPAYRQGPPGRMIPVRFSPATEAAGITFRHVGGDDVGWWGPGACFLDFDGDGLVDIFFLNGSSEQAAPGALYRNLGHGKFADATPSSGLGLAVKGLGCAVADYDNDGRPDLFITAEPRNLLFHNEGNGRFREVGESSGFAANDGMALSPAFVDLDHDGFIDLLWTQVSGRKPSGEPDPTLPSRVRVYRNVDGKRFEDVSERSQIGQSAAHYLGAIATDYDNHRDIDLVLTRLHAAPSIFSNHRDGTFSEVTPWPAHAADDALAPVVFDYNKDGWMDLFCTRWHGPPVLLENSPEKSFRPVALPSSNQEIWRAWGAVALDFDNDSYLDLAFIAQDRDGSQHLKLYRNLGDGTFAEVSKETGLDGIALHHARSLLVADYDDDGDPDLLVTQFGGPPILLRNDGGNAHHFLRVRAQGLKDNRLGIGTQVEVRAGRLWQKVEIYGSSGFLSQSSTEVLFGLGDRREVDFVRFLWPTGVIQDELPAAQARVSYQELDRKGGSCPILYAWDGERYRFVTDFIGPGVVGEWAGPGSYDSPDPDEYVKIEGFTPKPRNGRYAFQVTNQMEEVTYFDAARLLVLDHPANLDVFPNERFQMDPPFPSAKLWLIRNARVPIAARELVGEQGKDSSTDILSLIASRDKHYAGATLARRRPYEGFVDRNTIELDLGRLRSGCSVLLLNGWTNYFFPVDHWAAYQVGLRPEPPYLEASDGRGGWQRSAVTVVPAGLPRSVAVSLSAQFPTPQSRRHARVRLTTNLEIYWDQILVADCASEPYRLTAHRSASPKMRVTTLLPARAELHFLGFPREIRRRPEEYAYDQISPTGPFAQHAGSYTRYGDVRPLLLRADDMYVIMAAGDAIHLEFDAHALPTLPRGWKRTFIFYGDGFQKGMDFYDAHAYTVGPLPFHGMSRYPYPIAEHYPQTPAHIRYQLQYNTRHITGPLRARTEHGSIKEPAQFRMR